MNCQICNKITEHINICCDCFELVNDKLMSVKKFLRIEYINEITNLTITFCKFDQMKQNSDCPICNNENATNIKDCCSHCRTEIYKRSILLFNTQDNIVDIMDKACRCYEAFKIKVVHPQC